MTCFRISEARLPVPQLLATVLPTRCHGDGCGAVGCPVAAAELGGRGDGAGGNAAIVGQPDVGCWRRRKMEPI